MDQVQETLIVVLAVVVFLDVIALSEVNLYEDFSVITRPLIEYFELRNLFK